VVLEGERGLDSFATTNLDFILRGRGITTIAPGGFLNELLRRVDDAHRLQKGYHVITVADLRRGGVRRGAPERELSDVRRGDGLTDFAEQLEGAAAVAQ